jgi:hypothetical protein
MSQTIEKIMDRIKNLNEFEVTKDIPEGFSFNGTVPFDITIKGSIGTFKVLAVDINEADQKITKYIKENTQE